MQNQPHIHQLLATLPGSDQNKNTVNFTCEHARENGDNYEEEDGLWSRIWLKNLSVRKRGDTRS